MHCMFSSMFMLIPLTLIPNISNWKRQFVANGEFVSLETSINSGYDFCKPQHVHISFGDRVTEINIVWSTKEFCTGVVRFGTNPWNSKHSSAANYTHFISYNSQGLQHIYRVKLKGLVPKVVYYYQPESNGSTAGPFYFQVPPDENDWSPEFLMFGDLGIHANTISFLINEALSGHYTALIHVGDMAYDLKAQEGLVGDYFMKEIEPMAAYIPYLTCPGNHEIDFDSFSHYRNRFSMPQTDWPIPVDKMWYSIDIGPVHFISYSSEVFFTNSGAQIEDQNTWIHNDLKTANSNREKTPWIVAFGHRPLYCSTNIHDDCSLPFSRVRNGLEDIFKFYKVDLIIQAHEHNYERLWPMYNWSVLSHSYINNDVPVQIITGAAGSIEGSDMFEPNNQPNWSAFRLDADAFNSYGRLLVGNFTHIFWEQRSVENHTTLDSIWIVKDRDVSYISTKPTSETVPSKNNTFLMYIGIGLFSLFMVITLFLIVRFLLKRNNKHLKSLYYKNLFNAEEDETL